MYGVDKNEFYVTQIVQTFSALVISVIQTARIISKVKKYNLPGLYVKGVGLAAAIVGTVVIYNKANRILGKIEELNKKIK